MLPYGQAPWLVHRRGNPALVSDREFPWQAQKDRNSTPDLVGNHCPTDETDTSLTSPAPLSIDAPPRRVELNREAYLPAT